MELRGNHHMASVGGGKGASDKQIATIPEVNETRAEPAESPGKPKELNLKLRLTSRQRPGPCAASLLLAAAA